MLLSTRKTENHRVNGCVAFATINLGLTHGSHGKKRHFLERQAVNRHVFCQRLWINEHLLISWIYSIIILCSILWKKRVPYWIKNDEVFFSNFTLMIFWISDLCSIFPNLTLIIWIISWFLFSICENYNPE